MVIGIPSFDFVPSFLFPSLSSRCGSFTLVNHAGVNTDVGGPGVGSARVFCDAYDGAVGETENVVMSYKHFV